MKKILLSLTLFCSLSTYASSVLNCEFDFHGENTIEIENHFSEDAPYVWFNNYYMHMHSLDNIYSFAHELKNNEVKYVPADNGDHLISSIKKIFFLSEDNNLYYALTINGLNSKLTIRDSHYNGDIIVQNIKVKCEESLYYDN